MNPELTQDYPEKWKNLRLILKNENEVYLNMDRRAIIGADSIKPKRTGINCRKMKKYFKWCCLYII